MKKIIIVISILVYSNVGISQTKNDVLDLKNINYKLLDSLVFDEAMKERGKIGIPPIKKDLICLKIKNAKIKNYFCKKLILAVNATQLIDILINSNIVKNRDEISLTEHKFSTKITLFNNIKKLYQGYQSQYKVY